MFSYIFFNKITLWTAALGRIRVLAWSQLVFWFVCLFVFWWWFWATCWTACSWKTLSKKNLVAVQPPTLLHPTRHWPMGFSIVDYDRQLRLWFKGMLGIWAINLAFTARRLVPRHLFLFFLHKFGDYSKQGGLITFKTSASAVILLQGPF